MLFPCFLTKETDCDNRAIPGSISPADAGDDRTMPKVEEIRNEMLKTYSELLREVHLAYARSRGFREALNEHCMRDRDVTIVEDPKLESETPDDLQRVLLGYSWEERQTEKDAAMRRFLGL